MISLKKARNKINALSRVIPLMNLSKKKILMNSFFKSQFSYCLLVWMCHSRRINNKINHLHKRCLRVIYNDNISSFKELLERDGSVPIHNRNLQVLPIEMFKLCNQLHPYLQRFLINEIKTTSYATLCTFQFHLLEVYIMELKAYRFQVLRFGILC